MTTARRIPPVVVETHPTRPAQEIPRRFTPLDDAKLLKLERFTAFSKHLSILTGLIRRVREAAKGAAPTRTQFRRAQCVS